jgi:hypothetical protein
MLEPGRRSRNVMALNWCAKDLGWNSLGWNSLQQALLTPITRLLLGWRSDYVRYVEMTTYCSDLISSFGCVCQAAVCSSRNAIQCNDGPVDDYYWWPLLMTGLWIRSPAFGNELGPLLELYCRMTSRWRLCVKRLVSSLLWGAVLIRRHTCHRKMLGVVHVMLMASQELCLCWPCCVCGLLSNWLSSEI